MRSLVTVWETLRGFLLRFTAETDSLTIPMSNTFGIRTVQPRNDTSLDRLISLHSRLVPMPGGSVAVIEPVSGRPIDGELFQIRFRGENLFRRLTKQKGKITIISRSSRIEIGDDEAADLEIHGRVAFVFQFPNGITEEQSEILKMSHR